MPKFWFGFSDTKRAVKAVAVLELLFKLLGGEKIVTVLR